MLDQKQSEAAAEALLAEQRATQAAQQQRRLAADRRLAAQRRAAVWGVIGMGLGAAMGYIGFERWFPGAMLGFGVGAVLGRWLGRRRS